MYKLIDHSVSILTGKKIDGVEKLETTTSLGIPFDPANTDYQTFKRDIAEGVELQNAEGDVMTQEQVDEFLRTIP